MSPRVNGSRRRMALASMPAAACLGLLALGALSCKDDSYGSLRNGPHLLVELIDPNTAGSAAQPLAVRVDTGVPFRIRVRAVRADGTPADDFEGYVRLSAKPGSIAPLGAAAGADVEGRNVRLHAGVSADVDVSVSNAFGQAYILADDLGYVPVDPLRVPPPKCANGVDDDGDGKIDFPADEGCAFANDDTEEGGSYAQGASPTIFFSLPRVADVRGVKCDADPSRGCSGSGISPYPKEPVQMDMGVRTRQDGKLGFDFNVIVSRIASSGFYVTDTDDARGGYTSIFAFNFNAPPRMRVCDRMTSFGGTANEFYGFTQVSYPTWTLEEWNPQVRPCLVPEPKLLSRLDVADKTTLLALSGGLVRVATADTPKASARITPKFGPGDAQKQGDGYAFTADATNCDFSKDGKIDFSFGSEEGTCSNACTNDPECTEYSNYATRGTFRITVTDVNGSSAAVQADASAVANFDPVPLKGKEIRAFSGTLTYFSGGSQFTIEARCNDDVVVDLGASPLRADTCQTTADCPPAPPGEPPFECVRLPSGSSACRKPVIDPDSAGAPCNAPADCPPDAACVAIAGGGRACRNVLTRVPPPLACVTPRTILDINPQ